MMIDETDDDRRDGRRSTRRTTIDETAALRTASIATSCAGPAWPRMPTTAPVLLEAIRYGRSSDDDNRGAVAPLNSPCVMCVRFESEI
jgi:hypothetical protein